jgi:site-specific DNA recombinase
MRIEGGGYRRDYVRALAQRVEVDAQELRIMGSKSELLRTLVAASSAKTVGFGVPSTEVVRHKITLLSGRAKIT